MNTRLHLFILVQRYRATNWPAELCYDLKCIIQYFVLTCCLDRRKTSPTKSAALGVTFLTKYTTNFKPKNYKQQLRMLHNLKYVFLAHDVLFCSENQCLNRFQARPRLIAFQQQMKAHLLMV